MRQLGARLPETPRTEVPRAETPSSPQNRQPKPRFEELERESLHADQIHFDPRPRFDQSPEWARGFEAVPRQTGIPWGLLEPEPEKTHRFPFLTIAVPAIAALLALGALLWSGSMRDRLRQQDAAMNALQAQNQKMADTLEEMSVEQKASNALSASASSPSDAAPAKPAAPVKNGSAASPTQKTTPAPSEEISGKKADTGKADQSSAVTKSPEVRPDTKQESKPEVKPANSPLPAAQEAGQAKKSAADAETARSAKPVETVRAPELVPPYPTNYKPLGATSVPPAGTQAQAAGVYRQPFPVGGGARAESSAPSTQIPAPRSSYAQPPQAASRSGALPVPATTVEPAESSAGGSNGGALAQNVETVQGLQRHSTVPLQEFHVHEGMLTKVTPALGLSVRHPDSGRGTYSLVVNGSSGPYELRGQVNNPLVFSDNTTHREYELVVLRIADKQVYGYVRVMR